MMKKLIITLTLVLGVVFCSFFWRLAISCGEKINTWCPVQELHTRDFGTRQDEAELLMDGLESIRLMHVYLMDRLVNFDYNDYGKLELRINTLTYLLDEVNRAHKDVLNSITIFVKNNTGC